jgi:hypothetical protein
LTGCQHRIDARGADHQGLDDNEARRGGPLPGLSYFPITRDLYPHD